MKIKRVFSICLSLIIALFASINVGAVSSYVEDNMSESTENNAEASGGWMPDPYERLGSEINSGMYGLPDKYDPRNMGYLTEGKDQAFTGLCWMFAAVGAIEQYASKNHGAKFDLSEAHGAIALSNAIIPNGFTGNGYYDHVPNSWGYSARALQYFTNWNSPIFTNETCQWNATVSEESYPMTKVYEYRHIDDDFMDVESFLNVTDAEYVSDDINSIKQAIYSNGAVVTAFDYSSKTYFSVDENNDLNYYRSSGYIPADHAITLVGWDDNYSKDNFTKSLSKPNSDGAWLVRNSYHDRQYFWLSYEEGTIEDNLMTVSGIEKASSNEKMLSYDYFPAGYTQNHFDNEVYLCNVFDVSDYTDEYSQINKVMLYLRADSCEYEIKIAQLGSNGSLPENLDSYTALANGEYSGEGYLTVDLDTPYQLESNNKCAIVVKVTPKLQNSKVYIPFEARYRKPDYTYRYPEINSGESYYGFTGNDNRVNWQDCYSDNQYGIEGNLIIRPVLKSAVNNAVVNISPAQITDTDTDIEVAINANVSLFNIHTSNNLILRQDIDYVKTDNGIKLKNNYINSLNGAYTELVLEFNNDIKKTLIINPKSALDRVEISGKPIIGEKLSAVCYGIPSKEEYDVTYQWYSSPNGVDWYKIGDATSKDYTVGGNVRSQYIKVEVTAKRFGNVEYPTVMSSQKTSCKAVILGDVDLNGELTVQDSTMIQKYLVQIVTLNDEQLLAADFNKDGEISVSDATDLQKYIVGK